MGGRSAELIDTLSVPLAELWAGLSQRRLRAEVMDQPELDPAVHRDALRGLARINALTRSAACFAPALRQLALRRPGQRLRLLDVACGSGDSLRALGRLGRRLGLDLELHGCDLSPEAIALAGDLALAEGVEAHFFQADALGEPLPGVYQLVVCSLFLHHLSSGQAQTLLRHMAAATDDQLLLHDLLRTRLDLLLTWAGTRLLSRSPVVHVDGPLSVGGAFRLDEVAALAAAAGLEGAQLRRFWPERFLLSWCRGSGEAGSAPALAG